MEFLNKFIVPASVEEAWSLLTDVPRIAPCLPGATVMQAGDNQYEGSVAVKVGPIRVSYAGLASFVSLDESSGAIVLSARGKESSGKGSAAALVHVSLSPAGPAETLVQVRTELQVTGKIAQFGRSAMADVGERIIAQFAANLEALLGPESPPDERPQPSPNSMGSAGRVASERRGGGAPVGGAVDLDALALAVPLLKRAAPVAGAFVVGILVGHFALSGAHSRPGVAIGRATPG